MSLKAECPIGLFDSGVGGLTVANAIRQSLPNEKLIYFGDTQHLPYGDKSPETIQNYSKRIAEFLLEKKCKAIVIACNTASAHAHQTVLSIANDNALVLDVINPVVEHVVAYAKSNTVGIIGTKGTINSHTYENRIMQLNPSVRVKSLATPLFVPMIEEGFIYDNISNSIISAYLSRPEISGIDSLILGCTHYPIIKNQISRYYNFNINVFDSAQIVANRLKDLLQGKDLLNREMVNEHEFYVSDFTPYFVQIAKMFFETEILLTKKSLWQ